MTSVPRFWVVTVLGVLIALSRPSVLFAAMTAAEVDDAMSRGYAAIESRDIDGAMAAFKSVVGAAPGSPRVPEAMSGLGHLQLRIGSSEAQATFESLVERYSESPEALKAYWRLGGLDIRRRYYDDAQAAFRAASEHRATFPVDRGRARLESAFVEIMKAQGDGYWVTDSEGKPQLVRTDGATTKVRHLEGARKQFESIRDEYAKSKQPEIAAIADCAIGEIYLLGKIPHLAEKAYWRAIRAYGPMPSSLQSLAHYGIGQAKFWNGDREGAVKQFDMAMDGFAAGSVCGINVAPPRMKGNAGIWKVVALERMNRLDEALAAVKDLDSGLQSNDPGMTAVAPKILLWKGSLLSRTGSTEPAAQALKKVIDDYPATVEAKTAALVLAEVRKGGG